MDIIDENKDQSNSNNFIDFTRKETPEMNSGVFFRQG